MPRLPIPGSDEHTWGSILNEYLQVEHKNDGTHKLSYIKDADGDTAFEAERNPDEDIARAKAGGQDIFEGYSSGIFSLVKQSYVAVRRTTPQTIANETDTKVEFNVVDVDHHSEFDTTNYRFTATKPGIYIICMYARWTGLSSGNLWQRIYKNGNWLAMSETTFSHSAGCRFPISTCAVKLNSGDYIEGNVRQNSGGDLDLLGAYMEIIKVA